MRVLQPFYLNEIPHPPARLYPLRDPDFNDLHFLNDRRYRKIGYSHKLNL